MISAYTLIAFRRNELNLFWSGNFYDEILFDPFKNEMDKRNQLMLQQSEYQLRRKGTKDIKSIFNIYSQIKDIKALLQISNYQNKHRIKKLYNYKILQHKLKRFQQQSKDAKYNYFSKIIETQSNELFLYYISTVLSAIKNKKPTELDELIKDHFSQTYQVNLVFINLCKLVIQFDLDKVINLPRSNNLKTIVFDLDEALNHCNQNISIPGDIILPITFSNDETAQASINIRPYAKQIVQTLSKHFEIIVFTASHSSYANIVIDYLDPELMLKIYGNHKLSNVLLVDNASIYLVNKLRWNTKYCLL